MSIRKPACLFLPLPNHSLYSQTKLPPSPIHSLTLGQSVLSLSLPLSVSLSYSETESELFSLTATNIYSTYCIQRGNLQTKLHRKLLVLVPENLLKRKKNKQTNKQHKPAPKKTVREGGGKAGPFKKGITTTFAARMPLLWKRGFLLVICWIIVRSSPTPGSEGHSSVTDCPSCALTTLSKDVPSSQPEMVEAVKKHILNMLHLRDRPNITQPVPKAALLNAIKKLHVGKVGDDGYVEIEDDVGRRAEMNEVVEQTSEIITFAESGECLKTKL